MITRSIGIFLLLILIQTAHAQTKVESKAYNWDQLKPYKEENRLRADFVDGPTTLLNNLEVHVTTLDGGNAPHASHAHVDQEELVIVKEGSLDATIGGEKKTLTAGGIAYVLPGVDHGFFNATNGKCVYYIIKYKGKNGINAERGKSNGGSFMMNFDEMIFKAHDKGGRRNGMDHPTAMFDRFELHVTTLKKGLASHAPHTHMPEEILLIRSGKAELTIGDKKYQSETGGLIFFDSNVPHNLTNVGDSDCEYFAFQWN